MLGNWRKSVDNGEAFGAFLMDLSKALMKISHTLTNYIHVVLAYGFNVLKLIHDYLSNRKQRTKVNSIKAGMKLILVTTRFDVKAIIVQHISK